MKPLLLLLFSLLASITMQAQILTQRISNHPLFEDVERYVDVTMQTANSQAQTFEFWYNVRYVRDSVDVTEYFAQPTNQKISTDNTQKITLRDSLFNPIPNPDWDSISTDWYDQYLWIYGWDMIMNLISQPTNICELIGEYIIINDEDQYFDN